MKIWPQWMISIREDAVKYIQKHASDEKPFFMYVCFMKVHNPNNPSPRFKGKSAGGGNYLDSLMELDDNSGQILQAIRDAGIDENTIVVWTTDNGAWIDAWPDAGYTPFRGMKGTSFEGGFRCPSIVWVAWPYQARYCCQSDDVAHGEFNNPPGMKRLFELLEPSSQKK